MNAPIVSAARSSSGKTAPQRTVVERWRQLFRRSRPSHDPMLVFNMSIFNLNNGWNRIFNPLELRRHD